ncbi:MAG: methylenetetrahydrofolate reductase [NAD(P)H] [Vulcanimicrobiaceae bacterium]
MRIEEALVTRRPFFSFEFFPPKSDDGHAQLISTIETLRSLRPSFVSITYGAGGSTRARTLELAKRIQNDTGITTMAHVTCVGHTRAELRNLFYGLRQAGIENVLALRGDAPRGEDFSAAAGGFAHAVDLIAMLGANFDFSVGAACYPEKHIEAQSFEADLRYGITVPILPGIMPITGFAQIAKFTAMCGASIPPKLYAELELRADQPDAVEDLGVSYATLQCMDLLKRGAPGIHFYTLNNSPATRAVVSALLAATAWTPLTTR